MFKNKLIKMILSVGFGVTTFCGASSVFAEELNSENETVSIMTHNVYMLSRNLYPNWGQVERADLISSSDYIKNQDVVILNEVFDNGASNQLLQRLSKEYPFQTPVLGREENGSWDKTQGTYRSSANEDGGVAIVSKWPIVEKIQYIFNDGCGWDWKSNKGFVYTKIKKNDRFIHVIGTHLQAEESTCNSSPKSIRSEQLQEIQGFIKEKNIPSDEYVFIGGDLNVNKINGGEPNDINNYSEYASMFRTLQASVPMYTGHTATWDPKTNGIAKYNYPDLPAEYLDYILVEKNHAQPKYIDNKSLIVKSPTWSVNSWFKNYTYNEFSDHYPVSATINLK